MTLARQTVAVAVFTTMMLAGCGGDLAADAGQRAFVAHIASTDMPPQGRKLAEAEPRLGVAAVHTSVPSAHELFDWAEYRFAELFTPAGTQPDVTIVHQGVTYTVRSYPNGNHLGVTATGGIYGLGPFTQQLLTAFGSAADYAEMVAADHCIYDAAVCFALGIPYTVGLGAVQAGQTVVDPNSKLSFAFASGASGQLRITPLTATPQPPAQGSGWRIEPGSSASIEIVLDGSFDGSASLPAVFRYVEAPEGIVFDDARGLVPRWLPVPLRQVSPGRYAFDIASTPAMTAMTASDATRRQVLATSASQISRDYWVSQQDKASTDGQRRVAQQLLAGQYVDDFISALPATIGPQVSHRRAERLISWGTDGNWYKGFWEFTDAVRTRHPSISVTFDNLSLAHEVGHYLTHLLVGDAVYATLEAQPYPVRRWWIPGSRDHGIGVLVGRTLINEDYAYFIESFLYGTGGGYNLMSPRDMLLNRPAGDDVPGMEGFTALMLASLVRTSTGFPSIDVRNATVDAPVVGMSYGQVFGIIATGATDVNALRRRIESALDAEGVKRFRINLQRLAWRYTTNLRVLDPSGQPLANTDVRVVGRAGGAEYLAEIGHTDTGGNLRLSFAFPGESTLVARRGSETLEGSFTIDPDHTVAGSVAIGDVKLCNASTGCADKNNYSAVFKSGFLHSWFTADVEVATTGTYTKVDAKSTSNNVGPPSVMLTVPRPAAGTTRSYVVSARLSNVVCHSFFPSCSVTAIDDSWKSYSPSNSAGSQVSSADPVTLTIDDTSSRCQLYANFWVQLKLVDGVPAEKIHPLDVIINGCT